MKGKPWLGPGLSPLQLYLREEREMLALIAEDLRDAASDAQRRLTRLSAKSGVGAHLRRSQFTTIHGQLRAVQYDLWRLVGKRVRGQGSGVAAAAAEAERAIEEVLFRSVNRAVPEELTRLQQVTARRTVQTYWARATTSRRTLSERVYRSRALTQGWIGRAINRTLLQGGTWQELSARVVPMIHPDTPGGVSYAAKRLARTELNNAFHAAAVETSSQNPYTLGMSWNLSLTHEESHTEPPEICERLAAGHSEGMKRGHYRTGEVPDKPHPQCLCYVASIPMAEDDFLRELASSLASPSAA